MDAVYKYEFLGTYSPLYNLPIHSLCTCAHYVSLWPPRHLKEKVQVDG